MRKLLFVFVTIAFTSCSTDGLVPCKKEGAEGRLCREYRYFDGSPSGYIEFDYKGDSLVISDYYDSNSKPIKTIRSYFENGRTKIISEQYPNQDSRIQTWHYTNFDSLETIVYGANDSVLEITYANGKRLTETYFHAGVLNRSFQYRYFLDDGKLYRIYAMGADSVQLSYRNFEYFSTGQNRVSHFTADHKLIGRRVFDSLNGLIKSVEFTDSTGTIAERADYIYDSAFNLIEKTELNSNQTYKSVFLYY